MLHFEDQRFPGQDPAKLLAKYPDRWKLIHLKDLKKGVATGALGIMGCFSFFPSKNLTVLGDGGVVLNGITQQDIQDRVGLYFNAAGQPYYLPPDWVDKVKADGSYSFTADGPINNPGSASATYTVTDADGKIMYSNPAFDTMLGYQPGELIGQSASRLNDFSAADRCDRNSSP